jgi:hypothetical protein
MKLVKGEDLTPEQRQDVNNAFPYAKRVESINPGWRAYSLDWDAWVKAHAFWITNDGRLAARRHCTPAHWVGTCLGESNAKSSES